MMKDLWYRIAQREKEPLCTGFLLIEKLTFVYATLTGVLILLLWKRLADPLEMINGRLLIVAGTAFLAYLYLRFPYRGMKFLRITAQMLLLNYWYPETYKFNSLFPNMDHIFAQWEQNLFGFQPALVFGRNFPDPIISEAFNLGYFSYYPLILILMVFFFLYRYREYERASFIVMCSFFIYYLVYILLPVAGPQYYFQAIGYEWAKIGRFPELGLYFQTHTDMFPAPGDHTGFFFNLVKNAQNIGERPTAAFPSSHVGITTIVLILAFRTSKKLGWCMLPFSLLLFGATVYIQAHYVIDAIAGFITALPVYAFTAYLYKRIAARE